MTISTNHPQAWRSIFWRTNSVAYNLFLVVLASAILAAAAQVSIPLQPVPVTLQTFAVVFLGMSLGGWRAGCAIVAYWLEGLSGLPVFTQFTSGVAHFVGPTAGYLWAFLPAAMLAGYGAQRGWARHFVGALFVAIIALALMLFSGFAYLRLLIGTHAAWTLGVLPFLIGEAGKAIVLGLLIPRVWRRSSNT